MPTAGKSKLAENLSRHLNLPWISTDQIGIVMRAVADKEKHPALFTWENYDGFSYLNKYTADEIVGNEFASGEAVWPGVKKLIQEGDALTDGLIIEGVGILPHLVARDFSDANNVRAVFIGDHDAERVREVVFTRNFAGDEASAHPDELKEKEIKWVLRYGEKLKAQVLKHQMPWIEVEKNEHDLARVLTALG